MKASILSILLTATFVASAVAQPRPEDPSPLQLASATLAAEGSDGEVRKIDKDAAKMTIRHGEIRNLDMPPMTMVFQVRDPSLFDKVKAGDKVRFRAEKFGEALVLTAIEQRAK